MCEEGTGAIEDILLKNDQNSTLINLFAVIFMSGQP